ncbi:MAG: hypothetical protein ACM3XP_07185 [Nitrososphaerales archaeon]
MNILHMWDQAGVACILLKFQRRLGHNVSISKRTGYDPFKIFSSYDEPLLNLDGKKFIDFVLGEFSQYDIIHVHSLYKIVPLIRKKIKTNLLSYIIMGQNYVTGFLTYL